MLIWTHITHQLHVIREFVVPSYHPERHYMRGPGPACARRLRTAQPAFASAQRG